MMLLLQTPEAPQGPLRQEIWSSSILLVASTVRPRLRRHYRKCREFHGLGFVVLMAGLEI